MSLVSSNGFSRLAIALTAALAVLLIYAIVGTSSARTSLLLSDFIQSLIVLWAACCAIYVALHSTGHLRSLWMLLGASLILATVAQSLETVYQNSVHQTAVGPWPSDIIFILWVFPAVMMLWPRSEETHGLSWLSLLDFAQLIVVALTAYVYFFYVTSRWDSEGPRLVLKIFRLQMVRDVSLATLFLVRAAFASARSIRAFFRGVGALFLLSGASSLISTVFPTVGSARARWTDFVWSSAFLFAAIFAATWKSEKEIAFVPERRIARLTVLGQALPLCIPLLVLFMGRSIATEQLTIAWGAVTTSFALSGTRLLLTNERYRRTAEDLRVTEDALRQSAEMFSTAFRASPLAITITLIPDGHYVAVNESFVRLTGYSEKEIEHQTPASLGLWVDISQRHKLVLRLQAGEEIREEEVQFHTKKGETITCEVSASLIRLAGKPAVLGMARDITARKRAEKLLRDSEEKFRTLVENMEVGVVMLGPRTEIQFANLAAQKFFRTSIDQVVGKSSSELGPTGIWEDGTEVPLSMHPGPRVVRTRQPIRNEVMGWRRADSGEILWSLATVVPQFNRDGSVARVIGSFTDITEHRGIEEALRQLSGRLLQLQDEERRRLGRELHDSLAQSVLAVNLSLAQAAQASNHLSEKAQHSLGEARRLLQEMSQEIRTMAYLLHPPLLDELGLVSAIREYAEGFSHRGGIRLDLDLPSGFGRLPQETETALFRIVQESLSNVQKHSGSDVAKISLGSESALVKLEVKDQGQGMNGKPINRSDPKGVQLGVGIVGMRERMAQLGGKLEIESGPSGTTVRATIPLIAEAADARADSRR